MEDEIESSNEINQKLVYTKIYFDFFKNLQEIACNSQNITLINFNDSIYDEIKNTDLSKKISNAILTCGGSHATTTAATTSCESNANSYLTKSQSNWEKKLVKNINAMCTDFNMPLAKRRNKAEGEEIKRLWNELGTSVTDLKRFRSIFTSNEYLEYILTIRCSNLTEIAMQSITGLIAVPLTTKSLSDIKAQYKNLSLDHFQSGLDESLNSIIERERLKVGQKVSDVNDFLLSKEFSKQGCTKSLRGRLWTQILNVSLDDLDKIYYNYLKQCVSEHDLLMDSIYYKDVKTHPVNDDQVFVFEDFLYQVLLVFSRDTHVLKCFESASILVPKAFIKGKTSSDQYKQVDYPPNGFIPYEGFSMLVAPICYVYNDPILLYFVFRKLFMTYFYKLTIISTDPQSILGLCALFENLMQSKDPKLFFHLNKLGVQPLRIAFKWIIRAFSGYLVSSQLLELWDRILAYSSLEILAVFSVGVFLFRKQNLMIVNSTKHVESILEDLTSLQVVPILQLTLI